LAGRAGRLKEKRHESDPATILTHSEPLSDALHAFKSFDDRRQGWVKVKLQPGE
jgi:threonine dehydrogenase-like Zn-dependent dehydrogenase